MFTRRKGIRIAFRIPLHHELITEGGKRFMRRALICVSIVLLVQSLAFGLTQQDKLAGRWAGTVDGIQGQQPALATFKKESDKYSGSISGLRPGADAILKDINID